MNVKYDSEYLKNTLYSGILCDVMDQMGHRNQSLGASFKMNSDKQVLLGKAFTSIGTEVYTMPENPLTAQCKVIDQMSEDEVYILSTRGHYNCAIFGELLATAIQAKKGVGAVIDGCARDLKRLREIEFPLFFKGALPTTSKGRCEVTECQVPIIIDSVMIYPGDIVFGDIDGVAIIPSAIADEVFEEALKIVLKEDTVRESLLDGAKLLDTYAKIGAI